MVREGLSRYAASSRARAFRTSLICGGPYFEYSEGVKYISGRLPAHHQLGTCRGGEDACPRPYRQLCAAARGKTQLSFQPAKQIRNREDAPNLVERQAGRAIDAAFPGAKGALRLAASGSTSPGGNHSSTFSETPSQQPNQLHTSSIVDDASVARHITHLISRARTWTDLATITHEYGGATALNEIHLSAALSRLAKMDLTAAPEEKLSQHRQEQQPQQPQQLSLGPRLQVPRKKNRFQCPPLSLGPSRLSAPAATLPPPRPSGLTPAGSQPSLPTIRGARFGPAPRALPLTNVGQPLPTSVSGLRSPPVSAVAVIPKGAMALSHLGAPRDFTGALTTSTSVHDGHGHGQPRLETSPEGLCVALLDALARRCGSQPSSTAVMTAAEEAALPPLPARVLANATWGAARLIMQLWPPREMPVDLVEAARSLPSNGNVELRAKGLSERDDASAVRHGAGGPATSSLLQRRAWAALRSLLALVPDVAPSLEPQHISSLLYSVAQLAAARSAVEKLEVRSCSSTGGAVSGSRSRSSYISSNSSSSNDHADVGVTAAAAAATTRVADGEVSSDLPEGGRAAAQGLVAALLNASLPKLSSFGPQALSNSLYAVASMGISPPQRWLRAWLGASVGQLVRADPQHIANMLWAFARLGYDPGDPWVMAALRAAALKAPAFTIQGLCNTLWALAKLGFKADDAAGARALLPLLSSLGSAARGCGGQDVANGMWAIARLHMRLPSLPLPLPPPGTDHMHDVSDAPARDSPETASGSAQAVMAAAAAAPPPPPPLLAARDAMQSAGLRLLQASSRHLHAYSPQQLANTSWAAAVLNLQPPPEWEAQFWLATQVALPAMRTEELVGTAMASAKLRLQPPDQWLAAVLELTSQAMLQQRQQKTSLPQPLMVAAGPVRGDGLPQHNGTQRSPSRVQATGRMLASLLWCVETWQVRVPVTWTSAVLEHLEWLAKGGLLEPAALAMALQAMARMGLRPDAVVSGWTARVVTTVLTGVAADWLSGAAAAAADDDDDDEEARRVRGDGAPAGLERHAALASEPGLGPGIDGDGNGKGRHAEGEVGDVNSQCARMLLWSLARLHCHVADDIAGELALRAAECDVAAAQTTAAAAATAVGIVPAAAVSEADAGPKGNLRHKGLSRVIAGPSAAVAADAAADGMFGEGGVGEAEETVPGTERWARNVCVALWALACLSSRPSAAVMRQLERRAALDVPWASDSELLTMVHAFAVLGFRPGIRFRRAAEERVVCLAFSLSEEQVAVLMASCARLQWRLSKEAQRVLAGARL